MIRQYCESIYCLITEIWPISNLVLLMNGFIQFICWMLNLHTWRMTRQFVWIAINVMIIIQFMQGIYLRYIFPLAYIKLSCISTKRCENVCLHNMIQFISFKIRTLSRQISFKLIYVESEVCIIGVQLSIKPFYSILLFRSSCN